MRRRTQGERRWPKFIDGSASRIGRRPWPDSTPSWSSFPTIRRSAPLSGELQECRARLIEHLLTQLEAARQVNDAERVFERFEAVANWVESERRVEIEQDLARWFMGVIQRRLLTGKIQPEVVELATRVSSTFDTTREGASLRASLPTLRRSVGLCPRSPNPIPVSARLALNALARRSWKWSRSKQGSKRKPGRTRNDRPFGFAGPQSTPIIAARQDNRASPENPYRCFSALFSD